MHCKSYSHFFSKKFQHICVSLDVNFNESLTNDVVSFEQLGPGLYLAYVQGDVNLHILHMLEGTFSLKASNVDIEIIIFLISQQKYMLWSLIKKCLNEVILQQKICCGDS